MLDVETVAAGGGSILAFDGLRARVGPASAGADPGPAATAAAARPRSPTPTWCWAGSTRRAFPRGVRPRHDQPLDPAAARARLAELAKAMGAASVEALEKFAKWRRSKICRARESLR